MMKPLKRMQTMNRLISMCAAATLAMVLAACAVTQQTGGATLRLSAQDKLALLPVANHTDVPQAGLRAEAVLEVTLRAAGAAQLQVYPPDMNTENLFEPAERKVQVEAEKWARAQGIRYVVLASVDEWRYKVGVDGEPAVGLAIQIKDLQTQQMVYAASGASTGWSREALTAVAQKLMGKLLSGLSVSNTVAQ
jgi:polysaccharide biosynthesis protein PelC